MKYIRFFIFLNLLLFPGHVKAQLSGIVDLLPHEMVIYSEEDFHRIRCEEYSYTDEYGKPELPVKVIRYVVPFDAEVTGINVEVIESRILPGNFRIYPAQPPIPSGGELPAFVPADSAIYASTVSYPGKRAEVTGDGYMYGYHVVTLRFYPVEYSPVKRQLIVNKLSYTLNYTLRPGAGDAVRSERQSARRAEMGKAMVRSFVVNPQDVERFGSNARIVEPGFNLSDTAGVFSSARRPLRANPVMEQLVPDYLIITNETLKPVFQRLADWKIRKGVPTVIKTIEEIDRNYSGNDLQERIRNFLKDAYKRWGANLFVLIGGDVDVVPARLYSSTNIPTDLYYTTVGGDWNNNKDNIFAGYTDEENNRVFFLGRAPVENSAEANVFIDKVLAYETTAGLPDLQYINNYFAVDGFLSIRHNVLSDGGKHILAPIKDILPAYVNYKLIFENHDCSGRLISEKDDSGDRFYNYGTPTGSCIPGDAELNRENFLSALNNGNNLGLQYAHIIYHMDHSSEYGLGAGMSDKNELLTISDIDGLQNGKYYQIIFSGGCHPANFTADCIAEHYLNLPESGCVAFIGNTDNGHGGEQKQFQLFCNNLYSDTIFSYKYALGYNFQQSLSRVIDEKNYRLHLLGDPEMPVWTNIPDSLEIGVNPTFCMKGENEITVTINNLPAGQEAIICLYKKDEGYIVRSVRQNGSYSFPFTVKTKGEVQLTVTSHNFIPFMMSLRIGNAGTGGCYITDMEIDDTDSSYTQGNGDRRCDAGETIEAYIKLCNANALTSLSGVTAKISCLSPYITLRDSILNFGTIRSGAIMRCDDPFCFTVAADAPEIWQSQQDRDAVIFYLDISDSRGGHYKDSVGVDVFAPEIEQRSKPVTWPEEIGRAHV